jgi:EpsI family protein
VLSNLNNWQVSGTVPLQQEVVETLKLDDYLYQNYSSGDSVVSLYIGYYATTAKVGAAHDPLVCMPGQGWLVKDQGSGKIEPITPSSNPIDYSTMVVERNGDQELFLYWFQSYDKAVSGTFSQKIASMINKIRDVGQDNAFVRISCSMNNRSEQQCRQILLDFTKEFYPRFLVYIRGEG